MMTTGLTGLRWSHRLTGRESRLWPYALATLAVTIAIDSFLFHTCAEFWSMPVDRIPIL